MEKKTYIAPETVEDVVASQKFCQAYFEAGSTNEKVDDNHVLNKERNTFENEEKDWGEVEKNIW